VDRLAQVEYDERIGFNPMDGSSVCFSIHLRRSRMLEPRVRLRSWVELTRPGELTKYIIVSSGKKFLDSLFQIWVACEGARMRVGLCERFLRRSQIANASLRILLSRCICLVAVSNCSHPPGQNIDLSHDMGSKYSYLGQGDAISG